MSDRDIEKDEAEEPEEKQIEGFEVLAEWVVRRLRPLPDTSEEDYPEKAKRWVLFSLGMDKTHQDIFLHLEKNLRSTSTDIASTFGLSPNTARKYLDELHTVGLVDYVGREYTLTYESLSRAIELMLIPRITDTLRAIARGASSTDRPFAPPHGVPEGKSGDVESVVDYGAKVISRSLIEAWYGQGKKIRIKSYGNVTVNSDVDPEVLDTVIERIDCYGSIRIPTQIYARMASKIKCYGSVNTYD
jgi:predicted transcriptional regulator